MTEQIRDETGKFVEGTPSKARKFTEEQCIEAVVRAHGVVSVAARHLGTSARTLRRYFERYPSLHEARAECERAVIDLAEGKLYAKVNEGNMTAIIFLLKCKAKDRGYVERGQIEVTGNIKIGPDLTDITDDALNDAVGRLIRGEPEILTIGVDDVVDET